MNTAAEIREALRSLPNLAISSTGRPPVLGEIFFPEGHAEVLDPEVSLVIGNRGMGKTFWSLVLADDKLRPEVAKRYLNTRRINFDGLKVSLGFVDAEGARGMVSRAELEGISGRVAPELIWRAVLLRYLKPTSIAPLPSRLKDLVEWVRRNPDEQLAAFREADRLLHESGERVLFLFDQLDQLADNWGRIQQLTQGLLKIALAMKSYRSIKIKIFMRPDQSENKSLFRFPDASKISGGARTLSWRATDLYGLLFFEIMRDKEASNAFQIICSEANIATTPLHARLLIPASLVGESEAQGLVFDRIAGGMMGKGTKRGRPYSWIPAHLADGRGEISPRTFLQVIKTAAEWQDPPPGDSAIDFYGIQEGVRHASSTRLAELQEDYPWIPRALSPLRGLSVPCAPEEIWGRWKAERTVSDIMNHFVGPSAPLDLVVANLLGDGEGEALVKLLREVGVFEERDAGRRINVPDIFRVKAGILRKGGVTPQQRRRL